MSWLNSFKKQSSGLSNLACAIIDVSYKCGQAFKEPIDEKFGKDSKEAMTSWAQVQYEFLFFFTHLAMRSTLSKLGNDKRIKLQDLLGPILVNSTTETWFGHWPEKLKSGIRNDFFANLNRTEFEYAQYKGLSPAPGQSPKGTLLWELAKNIARLSGYENNPEVILYCIDTVINHFNDLEKIENLVVHVGKKL
jgi:hypothetical protein